MDPMKNDAADQEAMKLGERLLKLLAWPENGIWYVFFPPYQTNDEILKRTLNDE